MRFRVLGRILAAQALSSVGTSVSSVALAFMVYQLTGSVLHMGGVLAISTFPLVATSFIGGAVLDRFSAKNLMVLADVVRAGLIFSMPFLAQEAVGLIYLVAGLIGVCSAVFNPGQIKLIGELTEREHLVRANSYLSVSQEGAGLIGYLVGGVLVTYIGYTLTFSIDAASYLISALLLLGLPKALPRTEPAPRLGLLIGEAPAVLARLWRQPGLRTNLLLAVFASAAVMVSVPNSYGLALEVFDRGAEGLAATEVLTASGLILGGLFFSRLALRGDKNRYVACSLIAMGICLVGVSFSGFFWLSIALLGLGGVANVGLFVPSITMFQETPAAKDKGRMIAVRAGFGQMGVTGGFLLGGVLGEGLGVTRSFLVAGVAGIGVTLAIYAPYSFRAARRAKATWAATVATGATRREANVAAREAALGIGLDIGRAWASAEAAAVAAAAGEGAAPSGGGPAPGVLGDLALVQAGVEEEK
jgi:MFS family permease